MKPNPLHDGPGQSRILRRAINGLRRAANDAPLELNPIIADKLREDLRELFDKPELKGAVEELVQFAFFLEDTQQAHSAAKTLLRISAEATTALRAQAKQLATRAQQAKAAIQTRNDRRGPAIPAPRETGTGIRKH